MPTAAPSTYRSGLCATGRHDRCRGAYGPTTCTCGCNTWTAAAEEGR